MDSGTPCRFLLGRTGESESSQQAFPATSQSLHLLNEAPSDRYSGELDPFPSSGMDSFGQDFFSFAGIEDGIDVFGDLGDDIAREAGGSWLNMIATKDESSDRDT